MLDGGFGFGGGFLSSAVSQKMNGGEIDWWKAFGAGMNGLAASGVGIPAALFANTLAGTAGSAAERQSCFYQKNIIRKWMIIWQRR